MSSAQPPRCPICGQYLTTHLYFYGRRCLEPDHWLAAGLLHADDYYPLGQLVVQAALEPKQQTVSNGEKYGSRLGA